MQLDPHGKNISDLADMAIATNHADLRERLSRVRAVLFDLDGLIFDSERLYLDAWRTAASEQGFHLADKTYHEEFVGRTNSDCEEILVRLWGPSFDRVSFRSRWPECLAEAISTNGVAPKEGLDEVLGVIDSLGLKRAVATSSDRRDAERCLDSRNLRTGFGAIVTGDEIVNGKPAPDIYLAAAELLGVPPAECLVLEDSDAGIRAAGAAGMMAILIPDLKRPSPSTVALAAAECRSLLGVAALLREAFGGNGPC